jgi:hypothetical protein
LIWLCPRWAAPRAWGQAASEKSKGWPRSQAPDSHVSDKQRDPSTSSGQAMGTPLLFLSHQQTTAGGRIVITKISVSLIRTGPGSPEEYQRKLLQGHCSGEATSPRATGLRWM